MSSGRLRKCYETSSQPKGIDVEDEARPQRREGGEMSEGKQSRG